MIKVINIYSCYRVYLLGSIARLGDINLIQRGYNSRIWNNILDTYQGMHI